MSHSLIIGYGSSLHRDDAAGLRVAERVAEWGRPDVRALAVHQLTPELTEPMRNAGMVLFVDASVEGTGPEVRVRPLQPAPETGLGHTSDPRWLLALCQALHGSRPEAWLITIPVADLELGEGLSALAEAGMAEALRRVTDLVGGTARR